MLFTDIEGSTAAARALGDRWPEVLAAHHAILERAILEHHGFIEGTEGDAFFGSFATPQEALMTAREAQEALRAYPWPEAEVRVRMGIHTGVIQRTATGAVGLEVHRAARICAAAHGRQVVVSSTTRALGMDAWAFEDLGEHRLKDFPQPERLFQLVVGEVSGTPFAPLRTLPVRPTNIPALESPLIGRHDELDRLYGLLTSEARLVTVTGRGGAGKTRLVLAAGVELLEVFKGGVWFVPLADVDDSARLLTAIADRIGVSEETGGSLLDEIGERLEQEPTLLILDNLEQLRDVAATVDRLLNAAPSTRVLATSQTPLRLSREHLLTLGPLPSESGVQLFLERMARRGSAAAVEGSLAAVGAICEQLDGLPLAIELAAARTVALTPDELLQRLTHSLDILTIRERDRPARQRSLRATIEWSLGLLEPEDADLFLSLTVFAGTFTLVDAEAVAGADAFEGIEALVEYSFVRRVATDDYAARFTIAQALREFGYERLYDAGRFETARAAHARWVLSRAEAAWQSYVSDASDLPVSVKGINDDARVALEFLRDRDPALHLQLIGAYVDIADEPIAGLAAELDHAIAAATEAGPMLARARLQAGDIALTRGQNDVALSHLIGARELALEHGPPVVGVLALRAMCVLKLSTDPRGARALAEQAVDESATAGGRTWATLMLAQVDVVEGRVGVEPLLAEQIDRATSSTHLGALLHFYADCALLRADGPAAVQRYARALRAALAADREVNVGDLEGLAMSLAAAGRPQDALEVDAIARGFRIARGHDWNQLWWEDLRTRHLDPIRVTAAALPDPADVTDLIAAVDRALTLADASRSRDKT